jgi:hypothetical protein
LDLHALNPKAAGRHPAPPVPPFLLQTPKPKRFSSPERPLFIRERLDGLYGTGTYLLSRVVEGLPSPAQRRRRGPAWLAVSRCTSMLLPRLRFTPPC